MKKLMIIFNFLQSFFLLRLFIFKIGNGFLCEAKVTFEFSHFPFKILSLLIFFMKIHFKIINGIFKNRLMFCVVKEFLLSITHIIITLLAGIIKIGLLLLKFFNLFPDKS